jgi:organic radical activating enzyme
MAKGYSIKAIFDTFQGEGARAGCRSIFIRFAGCNLWNGLPADRDKGKGACARWCDTDFAKGTKLDAKEIAAHAAELWGPGGLRWAVLTGGEPGLQLDLELIEALEREHFCTAVETNGTVLSTAMMNVDYVCLSPKLGGEVNLTRADEVKVVLPGHVDPAQGWTDEQLIELAARFPRARLFLNPMDPIDPDFVQVSHLSRASQGASSPTYGQYEDNVKRCIRFARMHPRWSLGVQLHKLLNLP